MCHSASVRWPTRQCLQCLLTRLLILCNYSNFELKTYSGCCLCCYFCCWCWCFSSRASLAGWHTAEQTEGRTEGRTETWRLSASALPSWHVTTHKPLDRRASSASTWTLELPAQIVLGNCALIEAASGHCLCSPVAVDSCQVVSCPVI